MSSLWLRELQRVFGEDRVEDALDGTALADLGRKHNFGLYVVRNAIDGDAAKGLMQQSKIDIEKIAANAQNQQFYATVQACAGACGCKYLYNGTTRHRGLNPPSVIRIGPQKYGYVYT